RCFCTQHSAQSLRAISSCRRTHLPRLDRRRLVRDSFLPLSRRKWKLSTASTTGDRIHKQILTDLGSLEIPSITRDLLQQYLEQKVAQGLCFSLVDHLHWDLCAIFRLAVDDRLLSSNPAEMLFNLPTVAERSRRILSPK